MGEREEKGKKHVSFKISCSGKGYVQSMKWALVIGAFGESSTQGQVCNEQLEEKALPTWSVLGGALATTQAPEISRAGPQSR